MLSIQTNVNSLVAQQNLSVNNAFQSKTIQQLTSGYRINSAGDDAAGLAVANQFRDSVMELTQGVQNANNGVGTLQIIDGGLSNISQMLDRLKTLATESGSGTFTGNRSTVNNEFQTLLGEIDRQATNINLNSTGSSLTNLKTYIGGAASANSNAQVSVNLTGAAVDTTGLKLNNSNVLAGGVGFANDTSNLNDPNALFLQGTGSETFTFNYVNQTGALQSATATVGATTTGYTGAQVIDAVNTALQTAGIAGITASISTGGQLQFGGNVAFQVAQAATGNTGTNIVQGGAATAYNNGIYTLNAVYAQNTGEQDVHITVGGKTYTAQILDQSVATSQAQALAAAVSEINATAGLNAAGVYAIANGSGNIVLTSVNAFTVGNGTSTTDGQGNVTTSGLPTAGGLFSDAATYNASETVTAPILTSTLTGNATNAINSIDAALSQLGSVQGIVGAGENQLNYAISLAQSQITNFSSAESQIRDADVAAEAANLSKSQVLQQASIAAMAQANSAPQQVLALLRQ